MLGSFSTPSLDGALDTLVDSHGRRHGQTLIQTTRAHRRAAQVGAPELGDEQTPKDLE